MAQDTLEGGEASMNECCELSEWSQLHNGGVCLRPAVSCSRCPRSISLSGPFCFDWNRY